MKKIALVFIGLVIILVVGGCATAPKTGFDTQKLNVVNLMGYSEDASNIKVGKEIWNDKITIIDLPGESEYLAKYDPENPAAFEIYTDENIKGDINYSAELAAIISCLAYIHENPAMNGVEQNALEHGKKTYQAIISNVKKANPNTVFKDSGNFKQYLETAKIEKDGKVFLLKK